MTPNTQESLAAFEHRGHRYPFGAKIPNSHLTLLSLTKMPGHVLVCCDCGFETTKRYLDVLLNPHGKINIKSCGRSTCPHHLACLRAASRSAAEKRHTQNDSPNPQEGDSRGKGIHTQFFYQGRWQSISKLAKTTPLTVFGVLSRLKRGFSLHHALTLPKGSSLPEKPSTTPNSPQPSTPSSFPLGSNLTLAVSPDACPLCSRPSSSSPIPTILPALTLTEDPLASLVQRNMDWLRSLGYFSHCSP